MYPHEDSTYMCIVLSTHMYPLSVQYLSCTPPPTHSPPEYIIHCTCTPTAPQGTLSTVHVPPQPPSVHYPMHMPPPSVRIYHVPPTAPNEHYPLTRTPTAPQCTLSTVHVPPQRQDRYKAVQCGPRGCQGEGVLGDQTRDPRHTL